MNSEEIKLVAGFLESALDIEDKMSESVYGEFLNRKVWPANLEDSAFELIKERLFILIKETEDHKKIFLNLKNNLNGNVK